MTDEPTNAAAAETPAAGEPGERRSGFAGLPDWARFTIVFVGVAVVLLAAFFGVVSAIGKGTKASGPRVHVASAVQSCLEKAGAKIEQTPSGQVIAQSALGGSFRAAIGKNKVILMFASDPSAKTPAQQAALDMYETQLSVAPTQIRARLNDLLFRNDDVVELWDLGPTTAQGTVVDNCLK